MANLPGLDPVTSVDAASEVIVRKSGDTTDKRSTLQIIKDWLSSVLTTNDFNSFTKEVTDTTYTLTDADSGGVISFNNASPITLTVPNGLSTGFYVGIEQAGAGAVTVVGSGANVRNSQSHTQTNAQYGMAVIQQVNGTEEYRFQGATV